jgi:hypothetical protein
MGRTGETEPGPRHFRELLVKSAVPAQAAARALRGAVRTALPMATESLQAGSRGGLALYHVGGRCVCGIQPSATFTLLHVHGVTPADAPGLKLGGRGKDDRHVRFASATEVREQADAIRQLLLKAARR